jgi:hypothetical protein
MDADVINLLISVQGSLKPISVFAHSGSTAPVIVTSVRYRLCLSHGGRNREVGYADFYFFHFFSLLNSQTHL